MPLTVPTWMRCLLPRRFRETPPRVAVVRLSGAIGAVSPIRPGLSIGTVAPSLERAFTMPGLSAVALVINSPGGSPVQSHLIYRRIRALAAEKEIKVFAFVEDAAASGGYMIACAADEIVADPASLVGSIGVVSAGFGFDRLIERIGIDRRVHTQGEAKAMLDPFRPENPQDIARLKEIQADVQALFSGLVRERRPTLDASRDLFTGAVWTGRQALDLGLVDALGDLRGTLRARYGEKVDLRLVAENRGSWLARLLRRAGPGQTTAGLPDALIAAVEERAAWARLGL
ncbi:MAG: S49 family peptidase [Methylorubrum extorquens]|jgi:signal peptide peptidase SppA|uniref:Protease SohB, belong to MEROPS peptidase family S49 (Protease IV family, clan S-) n=1 Tax=Methylorubrum extorquens (strain DSM 6343 / CIP 106787 / DM4) TaxID=661410 RepID=C7CBX1_METED|nr:S49 family peptidase [Methylorubrum extorquens]CAX25518.1 protease SohB, belong to MEROPS peptidase family S49 (protease IV family, clan S-) [Methylorubrum extorquens DM4]